MAIFCGRRSVVRWILSGKGKTICPASGGGKVVDEVHRGYMSEGLFRRENLLGKGKKHHRGRGGFIIVLKEWVHTRVGGGLKNIFEIRKRTE